MAVWYGWLAHNHLRSEAKRGLSFLRGTQCAFSAPPHADSPICKCIQIRYSSPSQGIARDEAILCIDGRRAARAQGFRYPSFSTERAAVGHAAIGAPTMPHSGAAALRGQLGPFVVLNVGLQPAETEHVFRIARSGRALFEQQVGAIHFTCD